MILANVPHIFHQTGASRAGKLTGPPSYERSFQARSKRSQTRKGIPASCPKAMESINERDSGIFPFQFIIIFGKTTTHDLNQKPANFFNKGQTVNILQPHSLFQLLNSAIAARKQPRQYTTVRSCAPTTLYLRKQAVSQIWSMGYSLPAPGFSDNRKPYLTALYHFDAPGLLLHGLISVSVRRLSRNC